MFVAQSRTQGSSGFQTLLTGHLGVRGEAPTLLLPSPVLEPRPYTLPIQGHHPAPTIRLYFVDHLLS